MRRSFAAVFSLLFPVLVFSSDEIVLECEQFDDLGGWTVESQFITKTGSSYLQAHGLGVPVADARTSFEVAEDGEYNVFVITRNWTGKFMPEALGAGRFYLVVNGRTLPKMLGVDGTGDWRHVQAGVVKLKKGTNTLALHDATGFDGRADAIVFTKSSWPKSQRSRVFDGADATEAHFDVVVAGGGVAGTCAAISAARLGMKVALVQDRPVLGGNNSSEVRVHLGGWCNIPPYERLGDVVAEIAPARGENAMGAANYEDDRKLSAVKAEKNISLFLGTRIVKADIDNSKERRITAAYGIDTISGKYTKFSAPLFIDCTGDGSLAALAGAWFRQGRESKKDWGEAGAPEASDEMTMGASVQWNTIGLPGKYPFLKEPWMLGFTDENCHAIRKGDWNWETGMNRKLYGDDEDIRDYGLLVVYSNWAHVKNSAKTANGFAGTVLNWVAQVAGKRESRRIMGDFMLTETDLVEHKEQPDGTCSTTWTIDLHYPQTPEQSKFDGLPFQAESRNHVILPYQIPYRCLYSKNIANLFMAGRNISVTHIALGSTRLMRTGGMMGEVVGMAASLCKKHGCDPRAIYKEHFAELQGLMEKGVGTPGAINPKQCYNVQSSLDKDIAKKYELAVWDHVEHTEAEVIKHEAALIGTARNKYDDAGVVEHFENIMKLKPDYRGDDVFEARYRPYYMAVKEFPNFPRPENEIKFGQTLQSMGVEEKKTAHLKDYFNPTNVTAAFQKLIDDPEVTTIVVDAMDTPYHIASVKFGKTVTGKRVLFKKGVKVLRCPEILRHTGVKSPGAMFEFSSCRNVIVESESANPRDVYIGYYGSREERLKLNKQEGSSGMHISHETYERATKNVVIRNLTIANCECDGLGIGPLWTPCEDIFVENVILESNFRQGCSACSYYSLYFKNVQFLDTCGGQPMAGLDIEPWDDYLQTCIFYLFDCTFSNNLGGAFLIATTTHEPITIFAKRCKFKTNGHASQVSVITSPNGYLKTANCPTSNIRFEDCEFESRGTTLNFMPCPMYNVSLKNCVIRDVRDQVARKHGWKVSPIVANMSRDFGVRDIPDGCAPRITFENVKVEGFENADIIAVRDEVGMMNIGNFFRGSINKNGEDVDITGFSYKAPDVDEPKTKLVPCSKLKLPDYVPAADEIAPTSGCRLCFNGAWWLKCPCHSYYFYLEKGRKVSFDFRYTSPYAWVKLEDRPLQFTLPSGKDIDVMTVKKGMNNVEYVADETGWYRMTPGLTLDAKSTIASSIEYYVSNVKGAALSYQADSVSDSFAKFVLSNDQKPYTGYFEVPAGGQECRIRVNFGSIILKDPEGNIVDQAIDGQYPGRYVLRIRPKSTKSEIWSFTTKTGGGTRGMRFFAPLNGIWSDSPRTLACEYEHDFKSLSLPEDAHNVEDGQLPRINRNLLLPDDIKKLDESMASRREFASKKEYAALKSSIEATIAKIKSGKMDDAAQHQIDDLMRDVRSFGILEDMEKKAASESPEVFELAAFCQAFYPLIGESSVRACGLSIERGRIVYGTPSELKPLFEAIQAKMAP